MRTNFRRKLVVTKEYTLIRDSVVGFCGATKLCAMPRTCEFQTALTPNNLYVQFNYLNRMNKETLGIITNLRKDRSTKVKAHAVFVGEDAFLIRENSVLNEDIPLPIFASTSRPKSHSGQHLHTVYPTTSLVIHCDNNKFFMSETGVKTLRTLCEREDFCYMCGPSLDRAGVKVNEIKYHTANYLSFLYSLLENSKPNRKGWHWSKQLGLYIAPLIPTFVNPQYVSSGGQSHSILLSYRPYRKLPIISRDIIEI